MKNRILYQNFLYLLRCRVREEKIDPAVLSGWNEKEMLELAKSHSIEGMLYETLKGSSLLTGEGEALWKESYHKVWRKSLLFEVERKKVEEVLEKAGIWYLPLKGAFLAGYYPKPFLRQMGDFDILFDAECRKQVHLLLKENQFVSKSFGKGYNDTYYKKPFFHFEMHISLGVEKEFQAYFSQLEHRLEKGENCCSREMKREDVYLYHLAHEKKHYDLSGVGVRYLLDLYYYLKKEGDKLDWNQINREVARVGCEAFEQTRKELVQALFVGNQSEFQEILEGERVYAYCFYGRHGNIEGFIENNLRKQNQGEEWSVRTYYLSKIFPGQEYWEREYPMAAKWKILIPFAVLLRVGKGLFKKEKWRELRLLIQRHQKIEKQKERRLQRQKNDKE